MWNQNRTKQCEEKIKPEQEQAAKHICQLQTELCKVKSEAENQISELKKVNSNTEKDYVSLLHVTEEFKVLMQKKDKLIDELTRKNNELHEGTSR